MSIVLAFELDRTYGAQNEDVAKKNKYNSVQVTKDIVVNNMDAEQQHDYIAEFSQSTSSSGNSYEDIVALKYGEQTQIYSDKRTRIDNFIGQVYYKTYSVSLDISLSQYSGLATKTSAPQFDYFFSGNKYDEIFGDIGPTIIDDETRWQTHINGNLSQDYFNLTDLGYSSYLKRNNYTVTNNIYRKTEGGVESDYNALDDALSSIQIGFDTTQDTDINQMYTLLKPNISNWQNDGSLVTFDMQIPYMIKIMQCYWAKSERPNYADRYLLGNHYDYYEYTFDSFKIQFYNDYEITGNKEVTYYEGNRVYSANDSFLFTEGNKFKTTGFSPEYSQQFASEIYENYQNGKPTIDIKYPLGPMYDDMGNQLYYIDTVGIVRKIGDNYYNADGEIIIPSDSASISENLCPEEGMKCVITNRGIPNKKIGTQDDIQYYYVQNSNLDYNGVALNELTLAESNTEPDSYIVIFEQPEHATMTVYYRGDTISSGAVVLKGYSLTISFTFDEHYGLPQNQIYVNGQAVSKGTFSWTWEINGNCTIVAPVQYLGGKHLFLQVGTGVTLSGSLYNGMEIFTNDHIFLQGTISEGYKASLFVDGSEQPMTPHAQYDFDEMLTVYDKDIYVSFDTEYMGVTSSINQDTLDYFTITRISSVYSDNSITNIVANTQLYKEDVIRITTSQSTYLLTVNGTAASVNTDITITGDVIIRAYVGQQTLENLGWDEINVISESGNPSSVLTIGDTKTFTTTNGNNLTARIVGFNQDKLYDNTAYVGITFDIEEVLPFGTVMNQTKTNAGGWGASYIRNNVMPQVYDTLPTALKNVIKTVRKKSVTAAGTIHPSSTDPDTIEFTNDKLWLFSDTEIYPLSMSIQWSPQYESETASPYTFWSSNVQKSDRRKNVSGQTYSSGWWTRSIFYANPIETSGGEIVTQDGYDYQFKIVWGRYYNYGEEDWTENMSGDSGFERADRSYGYKQYAYNENQNIGISFGFCI